MGDQGVSERLFGRWENLTTLSKIFVATGLGNLRRLDNLKALKQTTS